MHETPAGCRAGDQSAPRGEPLLNTTRNVRRSVSIEFSVSNESRLMTTCDSAVSQSSALLFILPEGKEKIHAILFIILSVSFHERI